MAGQTIAEKVTTRQNLTGESVRAGDLIDARVDGLMPTSHGHGHPVDHRDHAVEVGAKFGIFLADDETDAYVQACTDLFYQPVAPDSDAAYVQDIEIGCDAFDFQVAKPFRFDNVGPLSDVVGTRIDQARIGSCANGRFEDIEIAARMLAGCHVSPDVRFYISPASPSVYKRGADAGLVGILPDAGVQFESPGCSICQNPSIVLNEEVCITLPQLPASVEEMYEASGLLHVIARRLGAQGIVAPAIPVAS